jgi:hypothetical protein
VVQLTHEKPGLVMPRVVLAYRSVTSQFVNSEIPRLILTSPTALYSRHYDPQTAEWHDGKIFPAFEEWEIFAVGLHAVKPRLTIDRLLAFQCTQSCEACMVRNRKQNLIISYLPGYCEHF